MTTVHDTFTLERTFDSPVAEVWLAWTDPELRQRWFHAPEGWKLLERHFDLRVGGGELLRGAMPSGVETKFVSTYHVIEAERRIVSAYDMHVDRALISVSLATLELTAAGAGTLLRYTEQGAYVDGKPESPRSRKAGTSWHLDNLVTLVATRR